jgi:peptidoglycan/LPS O-acetylase OafA/YrhL
MTKLEATLRERHLPVLDGLRAIACTLVMVFHAGVISVPGDLGVTLFFVISGFLITWLLLNERDRTGTLDLRAFYLRRTLRIFPAYYALIVATIAARHFLGRPWTTAQVATALTYTVDFYIPVVNTLIHPTNHAWSLAIEEQFYLLWPICLLWLLNRGPRAVIVGVGAAIATVLALRLYAVLVLDASYYVIVYGFFTRFDSIAAGCLLAAVLRLPTVVRLASALGDYAWYALVTVVLICWSRLGGSVHYLLTVGFTIDSLLIAVFLYSYFNPIVLRSGAGSIIL